LDCVRIDGRKTYREKAISNTKIMKNPNMFSKIFIKQHLFLFEPYRSIIRLCVHVTIQSPYAHEDMMWVQRFSEKSPLETFAYSWNRVLKTFPKATSALRHISSFDLSRRILLLAPRILRSVFPYRNRIG